MALRITLTIEDIASAGGVSEAIVDYCDNERDMASSTHCDDMSNAIEAFNCGYAVYVSCIDGTCIRSENPTGSSPPEEVRITHSGERYVVTEWSDDSIVYLACPTATECFEHPEAAVQMIRSVEEKIHNICPDEKEHWARLGYVMRDVAQTLAPLIAPEKTGGNLPMFSSFEKINPKKL